MTHFLFKNLKFQAERLTHDYEASCPSKQDVLRLIEEKFWEMKDGETRLKGVATLQHSADRSDQARAVKMFNLHHVCTQPTIEQFILTNEFKWFRHNFTSWHHPFLQKKNCFLWKRITCFNRAFRILIVGCYQCHFHFFI